MTMGEGGGGDGLRRAQEYGYAVARRTERKAHVEGNGRASLHRHRGGAKRVRRFLRQLRNRNAGYECVCPTPPAPGERHRLDCELRNDGFT